MTATGPANSPSNCPECGAPLAAGAEKCWLCAIKHERPIGADRAPAAESPPEPPVAASLDASPPPGDTSLNRTFSLSSLFLWTTLLAVILGVVRIAPGLGIGLAILSLPAALFTVAAVGRCKRRTG